MFLPNKEHCDASDRFFLFIPRFSAPNMHISSPVRFARVVLCKRQIFSVGSADFMSLISAFPFVKIAKAVNDQRGLTRTGSGVNVKKDHGALQHSWGTSTSRWL